MAAESVRQLFGARLFGLPGSFLPHVSWPDRRRWSGPWHLWWMAHYLDCLVDAAYRCRRVGTAQGGADPAAQAHRLLRTIRWRNFGGFTNPYYDDMGWLLLAAQRLHELAVSAPVPARINSRSSRLTDAVARAVTPRLLAARTADLGGGLYWNTDHDFKNIPATGPAAIYFARRGATELARSLVDWMYAVLHDTDSGLFWDGIRLVPGPGQIVRDIYTYNQGLVLGTLLQLGEPADLSRAAVLIEAIETGLTQSTSFTMVPGYDPHSGIADQVGDTDPHPSGRRPQHDRFDAAPPDHLRVLTSHGGHDGGLFTGILVRYLALAARHPGMDRLAARTAARLTSATAEALWHGRRHLADQSSRNSAVLARQAAASATGPDAASAAVFSPDPARPAAATQPLGSIVELSTQVQAWMILEAAARLTIH